MALKLEKLNVLVVEDTGPMRKLIVSVLESFGIGKIHTADDGADGFKKYLTVNPDIIITDWLMQPVDGINFIKMVRSHVSSPNRPVPSIIITGYSAITRVIEARDNGVTEFLIKPFTANDLAKRISYVINRPRDFVQSPHYFGPDRRRKKDDTFPGNRRKNPGEKVDDVFEIDFSGGSSWSLPSR
jgi:DNA-binding response OmpR family regulator